MMMAQNTQGISKWVKSKDMEKSHMELETAKKSGTKGTGT